MDDLTSIPTMDSEFGDVGSARVEDDLYPELSYLLVGDLAFMTEHNKACNSPPLSSDDTSSPVLAKKATLRERLSLSYRLTQAPPTTSSFPLPPSLSLVGSLKFKPATKPNSILKAYNFSPKKPRLFEKESKWKPPDSPIDVDDEGDEKPDKTKVENTHKPPPISPSKSKQSFSVHIVEQIEDSEEEEAKESNNEPKQSHKRIFPPPSQIIKRRRMEEEENEAANTTEIGNDFEDEEEGNRKETNEDDLDGDTSGISKAGTGDKRGEREEEEVKEAEPLVLDDNVQVPGSIAGKLKDYQKEGVKFLYKLYKQNTGGILADDMGLGKTIQSIAFLSAIVGDQIAEFSFFKRKRSYETRPSTFKPALVVMPAGVIQQWAREFRKWGKWRVEIFHGKDRGFVINKAKSNQLQVMMTSYDTFRNNFSEINVVHWDVIIFDEIHKIKNNASKIAKSCKLLTTNRRYGLTGTVMQNSFEELWNLLDFVVPGFLGTIEEFKRMYIKPIKMGQKHDAMKTEIAMGRLKSKKLAAVLKKHILRRDKSIIADQLPGKKDNVVFCKLAPLQEKIYAKTLELPEFEMLRNRSEPCDCGSEKQRVQCCHPSDESWKNLVFQSISRLIKIANHPQLLDPHTDDQKADQEAAIEFQKRAFTTDYETITDAFKQGLYEEVCGKLRVLKVLLRRWRNDKCKILLFSYSTKMLDILQKFLRKEGYSYSRIDGSVPIQKRQFIVDDFNKNPNKMIFLISTKAGGLGLNLTSANVVVIFDPNWNPSHDLQAQDRAYRIGQTRFTNVYRLVSVGTIEEITYARQVYKQQMGEIGLHGKNETRYFTGVAGVKGEEGELFGMANLFKLNTSHVMTNEIIKRANKAEMETDFEITGDLTSTNDQDTTQDGNKTQSNNEGNEGDDLKDIFDANLDESAATSIEAEMELLLKNSGVVYSHNNADLITESDVETKLANIAGQILKAKDHILHHKTHDAPLSFKPASNYYTPTPSPSLSQQKREYVLDESLEENDDEYDKQLELLQRQYEELLELKMQRLKQQKAQQQLAQQDLSSGPIFKSQLMKDDTKPKKSSGTEKPSKYSLNFTTATNVHQTTPTPTTPVTQTFAKPSSTPYESSNKLGGIKALSFLGGGYTGGTQGTPKPPKVKSFKNFTKKDNFNNFPTDINNNNAPNKTPTNNNNKTDKSKPAKNEPIIVHDEEDDILC